MPSEEYTTSRFGFIRSGWRQRGQLRMGRKRHIVTDISGSLLAVQVHAANIQDVHGAEPLLKYIGLIFPKLLSQAASHLC
jgi:hypothetical protein